MRKLRRSDLISHRLNLLKRINSAQVNHDFQKAKELREELKLEDEVFLKEEEHLYGSFRKNKFGNS